MDGKTFEQKMTENYELGIWAAVDGFACELAKKSGVAYSEKKDDEAKILRRLSDEYVERARTLRQKYDEKTKA